MKVELSENIGKVTNFLFEIGTMRKIARMHRQVLLTDDLSDSIASHSFRVAMIGWLLAEAEEVDVAKVTMMCLIHDTEESRTGDHNWVNKKYVKIFNNDVINDQLGSLPFNSFERLAREYEERQTPEAIIAKDADYLDQLLLLREYEHQSNREAAIWLRGKGQEDKENEQIKRLKTKSAQAIGQQILQTTPSAWWDNLWTAENRS